MDREPPLEKMVGHLYRHGVTCALATVIAKPLPEYLQRIEALAGHIENGGWSGTLPGIHCEGPFLNPELSGGASRDHFVPPSVDVWRRLHRAAGGWLRMMTVSPELEGVLEVVREASSEGTVVSAGHTCADYERAEAAMDYGVSTATHLFNAMRGLHHRRPGVLLACVLHDELMVQVNAEGGHVHPLMMQMLYRLKGAGGMVLTSDAGRQAGLTGGDEGTDALNIRADGVIAGSTVMLDSAVRVMVNRVGVPLEEAVRMASLNPAVLLGLDDRKGAIAPGRDADLVVMDDNLRVEMVISGGEAVYGG